ncbi:MAG: hypothetical protein ACP5SK_01735 [Thermoprotei archaeon]
MEVYAEVDPLSNEGKLSEELRSLKAFDGLDVPHSPLGLPSVLPLAISARLRYRENYEERLIINQRLADVNELYIRSLMLTSDVLKLDVAFTVGDVPKFGQPVSQLDSESAIRIAREQGTKAKVGLFLSFRYPREMIRERMRRGADFFLAMRVRGAADLEGLDTSLLIPYVIISTDKNKDIIRRIDQPTVTLNKLKDHLAEFESSGIKSVLLSCPGDWRSLNEAFRLIR